MNLSLNRVIGRGANAWRDAAASAVAAAIAWTLAVWLLGHPHPVFAAVTAIVCLSPGLPSHGRQAVGLMLGVTAGIIVGEFALLVPDGWMAPEWASLLRLVLATFCAMVIAASFGQPPVVAIQAGVSAVLVLALGPTSAGLVRLEDVAIGVIVGLFFSQVLLTPDPVRSIDEAADGLLHHLASAYNEAGKAVRDVDPGKAQAALAIFSSAHEELVALDSGIASARYAARWSLRGRLASRAVGELAARYDRRAIRFYAASLLFGEALADVLRKSGDMPPTGLFRAVDGLAARCERLAAGDMPARTAGSLALQLESTTEVWRPVIEHLQSASQILASLEQVGVPSGTTPKEA
jgi:Predicted membrane protein